MNSRFLSLFFIFLFPGLLSSAQEVDTVPKLTVGIKESPPFVFKDEEGGLKGISVQLWEKIAQDLGVEYQYTPLSLAGILDSLEQGSIDLSINPLTVTSARIQQIDFTQPYYTSNSAIAVRTTGITRWRKFLTNFFSVNFLKAVLLLFLVIFIFGFVAWLFERKHNPEEFESGWKGLWSGVWWSAVTMTTVGYGDKSPRSAGGRIVALVWMFTAIIIISGFTAAITSALTIDRLGSEINSLNELRKVNVGTVEASASERFLRENYINTSGSATVEEGLAKLSAGDLEAFVYDEPILRYRIQRDSLDQLEVLPYRFNPQYYSFGLPKSSPLLPNINLLLLQETETTTWRITLADYGLSEQ
jgi:polar amino acid transport system substrate-binding protein